MTVKKGPQFISRYPRRPHLLSFADVPYKHMLAGTHGNISTLFTTPNGHKRDVGLLTADHPKHSACHIAQVLLSQAHGKPEVPMNTNKGCDK